MTVVLIIIAAIALIGGTWALLRWDDRRGDPGDGDREAATFRKIAREIAHEEYLPAQLAACRAVRPPLHAAPTITLAPAAPDATPKSGPAAGARAPDLPDEDVTFVPDGPPNGLDTWDWDLPPEDPPAGDAPGPDGAPEGDEQLRRPPQGTAGPGDLLAKAAAGIKALPVSDYLSEVQDATAWETRAPLAALLSDDTIARGIPAIKDEVTR